MAYTELSAPIRVGAATLDITPTTSTFLYGYPHQSRNSTGTHDPLLATAVVIENGHAACVFVSLDIIFVSKAFTGRARKRIAEQTGIAPESILISATHTHSGPVTVSYLSNQMDPIVPPPDDAYLDRVERCVVSAVLDAWNARRPATAAYALADATGVGTNRHNPAGASDLAVPVLCFRDASTAEYIAMIVTCAMHPTVLHEDSTLFSGDFPAFTRQYLQRELVGPRCAISYHTGASGNQSPRHVTKANTFDEAKRLGEILGRSIVKSLASANHLNSLPLAAAATHLQLPMRDPPRRSDAETKVSAAKVKYDMLKRTGAAAAAVRSAECDIFGAEETLALALAGEAGQLRKWLESILPAEIQVLRVGEATFVAWPGEFFVEFAIELRDRFPRARVITLANGELQGYVVTQEAVDREWYESGNALLKSPDAGRLFIDATSALLDSIDEPRIS